MILITAATGQVGRATALALLALLGRPARSLGAFLETHRDVFVGAAPQRITSHRPSR